MTEIDQESLKQKVGSEIYLSLEREAEKEVALALAMPLIDKYRQDKYYRQRSFIGGLVDESKIFQEKKIKISPLDVINILFRCKLLFATKSEDEYMKRTGGGSYVDEFQFMAKWSERSNNVGTVINQYFKRLEDSLKERTLITQICEFHSCFSSTDPQQFFEDLFKKLEAPFVCFFEGEHLVEKHKKVQPGLVMPYNQSEAKRFFGAPSIGFTLFGSEIYCYRYASAWLRTFLNILRISGFVYPPQIDFGSSGVQFMAPISSVFLGTHTQGAYCWEEDTKEPWAKSPDGCLFLSFGYRGLSKMWLDERAFGAIENFFIENKKIFENLNNPWGQKYINDIAPTIDILSSATQAPDLGAKILFIYCCLEHLFVPEYVNHDNKKYIIGAINALRPELLSWFEDLYKLRCTYAHKGFILRDDKILSLIIKSIRNVMALLIAKLSIA